MIKNKINFPTNTNYNYIITYMKLTKNNNSSNLYPILPTAPNIN